MRHKVFGKKLGRSASQRRALEKGLIRSFFKFGKIETTLAKAKFIRPSVERLVTIAKKGGLNSYRSLISYLQDDDLAKKLIDIVAPVFSGVNGGYVRVVKLGFRDGDKAQMARIEWVREVRGEKNGKTEELENKKTEKRKNLEAEKPKKGRT